MKVGDRVTCVDGIGSLALARDNPLDPDCSIDTFTGVRYFIRKVPFYA